MVEAVSTTQTEITTLEAPSSVMPFDPYLLDRAHTQYHFGDWDSLAHINLENLRHQLTSPQKTWGIQN
jgi:hypothetical protein